MTDPKLSQFKLLCFDCYGTLVDWESGIHNEIAPLIARAKKPWTRAEALTAFSSVETNLQAQNPTGLYSKILHDAYYALGKRLGLPEDEQLKKASENFGNSVSDWPVYPDTIKALERLSRHYRLVILSNVDKSNFSCTQKILEHGFKFDLIITAEEIGSYKPDPANFEYMLKSIKEKFGVEKHEVLVTAQSLTHDHKPANALGIASTWIDREESVTCKEANARYVFEFKTLGAMANVLEKELQEVQ